jgi:short-subunit dehydrogenase involved in D-alanine esterification of teichoic acids
MGSRINTILIIGATSGIGEAFARRFHSDGKKVIITGRRMDRLAALQNELPGIGTRQVRLLFHTGRIREEMRIKC